MTILRTCCCWKSLRHGSVASAVYTGIYYAVNAVHSSFLLLEDVDFAKNSPETSQTPVLFSSLVLAFSSCGVLFAILLLYGLYKDMKCLLIPWIFNTMFFTIVDVAYVVHGLLVHALQWNPSVAILITIDFFLNSLNLYTVLCVTSQYQEYQAGRGEALDLEAMSNDRKCLKAPLEGASEVKKLKKHVKFEEGIAWEDTKHDAFPLIAIKRAAQ